MLEQAMRNRIILNIRGSVHVAVSSSKIEYKMCTDFKNIPKKCKSLEFMPPGRSCSR
jgi:hypothetical protein